MKQVQKLCNRIEAYFNSLNDLEEKIRVLEFRNAKLHNHNEKIEREIVELRNKIKKLESDAVNQFRNKGDM